MILQEITQPTVLKLIVGKYLKKVEFRPKGNRLYLKFGYNKRLIAIVKGMEGRKWHGFDEKPQKLWSIPKDSFRNEFIMQKLLGNNPFKKYDEPLESLDFERPLYDHQKIMVEHAYNRNYSILACEMGTGKTLAFIELIERIPDLRSEQVWYVGPKSGIKAVSRELEKWDCRLRPLMYTYEKLVKVLQDWDEAEAPRVVCFDESSKIKTPTSQRSKAAMHVSNAVRSEWGDDGYVMLMSGTPAPKTPVDWYHQCEVACPGFLAEGNLANFRNRLCLMEQRESLTGGMYPHIITWLDDAKKCNICGELKETAFHQAVNMDHPKYHRYVPSKNEIDYLYERMKGLVLVQFKKDCLDLPEKRYEVINIKPTVEILQLCRLINKTSRRAIEALTMLRELSDGFQYEDVEVSTTKCTNCQGNGKVEMKVLKEDLDILAPQDVDPDDFVMAEKECPVCSGIGEVVVYDRVATQFPCPKDDYFIQELTNHADTGRYVVWGGFTGTVDRLVEIAHQQGYATLRVDGRGYVGESAVGEQISDDILLDAMDFSHPNRKELLIEYPKVCFVGHPQAGGMALTLTSSPTELFFSNCFSGEARMQAEDRCHRAGMDQNRGLVIKDLIHLPTDKLVLDNLQKKKRLQDISMGQLQEAFK